MTLSHETRADLLAVLDAQLGGVENARRLIALYDAVAQSLEEDAPPVVGVPIGPLSSVGGIELADVLRHVAPGDVADGV